jgi:hypothetical protein
VQLPEQVQLQEQQLPERQEQLQEQEQPQEQQELQQQELQQQELQQQELLLPFGRKRSEPEPAEQRAERNESFFFLNETIKKSMYGANPNQIRLVPSAQNFIEFFLEILVVFWLRTVFSQNTIAELPLYWIKTHNSLLFSIFPLPCARIARLTSSRPCIAPPRLNHTPGITRTVVASS